MQLCCLNLAVKSLLGFGILILRTPFISFKPGSNSKLGNAVSFTGL